jgi:GTPase SAR1 family protein
MTSKSQKTLPNTKQAVFVDAQLYTSFNLDGKEEEELNKFFLAGGTVDAWCPSCQCPSIFHIKSQLASYGQEEKKLPYRGTIIIEAVCGRGGIATHNGCSSIFNAVFVKDGSEIIKIGQNPSAADLIFGTLDEAFDKELSSLFRRELGTAIGLHAHGIGIGSFVYLRRIFESLIEEAHQAAQQGENWDETDYNRRRVLEKIDLLKSHLPSRLIQTANLYGILSLGIHELSEEDCLASFDLVKGAIELILKERHEVKRYENLVKGVSQQSQDFQRGASGKQLNKKPKLNT